MSKDEFKNEKLYSATMHMAKTMLKQGLISKEQYAQIDTKFTNKYAPSLSNLFIQIELI